MKALILDGSEDDQSSLGRTGEFLVEELMKAGYEPFRARLRDLKIDSCKGCFDCWSKHPGLCNMKDDAVELTRRLAQSDLLALLTPVIFGGYGSTVKCALERVALPILLPFFEKGNGEIHHPLRYGTPIRLAAVGSLSRNDPNSEAIFRNILSRNARNFHSPAYAASFVYHGMTTEALRQRAKDTVAAIGVAS